VEVPQCSPLNECVRPSGPRRCTQAPPDGNWHRDSQRSRLDQAATQGKVRPIPGPTHRDAEGSIKQHHTCI
jgi:hypothetical protein